MAVSSGRSPRIRSARSLWRRVAFTTGIDSRIVGTAISTKSGSISAASASNWASLKYVWPVFPAAPLPWRTSSSISPSSSRVRERIVCESVSPIKKAAVMISVASIRPNTMRADWVRRRPIGRIPSLNITRPRHASRANMASTRIRLEPRQVAMTDISRPNNFSMAIRLHPR